MSVLRRMFQKIINSYRRRDPIQYARYIGVKVGNNCRFVDNPSWGTEPYLISIGNHVLISSQVTFVNHDGSTFVFRETEPYKGTYKFGPIKIGDNCFIGLRSILLPNVSVGSDCIIVAGSVVTKSVPSGEVWGGVPARYIMKTEDYAKKCYENRLPYDAERIVSNKKEEMLRCIRMDGE